MLLDSLTTLSMKLKFSKKSSSVPRKRWPRQHMFRSWNLPGTEFIVLFPIPGLSPWCQHEMQQIPQQTQKAIKSPIEGNKTFFFCLHSDNEWHQNLFSKFSDRRRNNFISAASRKAIVKIFPPIAVANFTSPQIISDHEFFLVFQCPHMLIRLGLLSAKLVR